MSFVSFRLVCILSVSTLCACTSAATSAVSDASLLEARSRRSSLEDVRSALALAELGPLSVPLPTAPDEMRGDRREFWQAAALAWNPELRQMRRRVRELRALRDSAGRPAALELEAGAREIARPSDDAELSLTFDLLGLLALGPSAAARDLASAEERAALADFERAVWRLRFDVDRARARLAGALALEAAMRALYGECAEETTRIDLLGARGWIGPAMREGAYASLHMVEHRQTMAQLEAVSMRAELAALCGLDVSHPAFEQFGGGAIDRFRAEDVELVEAQPRELLERLPELRAAKLALALAEAELRREAREQWPMLRVGPQLTWMPGETLLGGMLGIDLPFPGALDGRIAAARERREAAREALEDALVARAARARQTHEALHVALAQFEEHAPELDLSVARMLVAARAEFRADPERLDKWSLALRERVESLTSLVEARVDAVVAELDDLEARGVAREEQP